jgi:peptide deformylase
MKLIVEKDRHGMMTKEFKEFLKTPIVRSDTTQTEADKLRKTLEEALEKFGGLGISATQIGIKKRACYIKLGDEELFLLNPVIKDRGTDGFLFFEGCLSIPATLEKPIRTVRATKVVVDTDNLGELTFEVDLEGDKANEQISMGTMKTVVVQHEIDHMDGITIRDRQYNTTVVKKTNYGRNEKIIMKSTTGEMIEVKSKKANDYFLKGYEIV